MKCYSLYVDIQEKILYSISDYICTNEQDIQTLKEDMFQTVVIFRSGTENYDLVSRSRNVLDNQYDIWKNQTNVQRDWKLVRR